MSTFKNHAIGLPFIANNTIINLRPDGTRFRNSLVEIDFFNLNLLVNGTSEGDELVFFVIFADQFVVRFYLFLFDKAVSRLLVLYTFVMRKRIVYFFVTVLVYKVSVVCNRVVFR